MVLCKVWSSLSDKIGHSIYFRSGNRFLIHAAARIADKIGLINTMVFTHLPANILIIVVAFAPTLPIVAILYFIRMALSQMDVPTRQSYIVSVVKDEEGTVCELE